MLYLWVGSLEWCSFRSKSNSLVVLFCCIYGAKFGRTLRSLVVVIKFYIHHASWANPSSISWVWQLKWCSRSLCLNLVVIKFCILIDPRRMPKCFNKSGSLGLSLVKTLELSFPSALKKWLPWIISCQTLQKKKKASPSLGWAWGLLGNIHHIRNHLFYDQMVRERRGWTCLAFQRKP